MHAYKKKPEERSKGFEEVVAGYSVQNAVAEATRCLKCFDAPCVKDCPAKVDIPTFIGRIETQDIQGAINTIRKANPLPGVCARVCPTEQLCEKACCNEKLTEAIDIGSLQRFASDFEMCNKTKANPLKVIGKRVAIVGSGPTSLAAAARLVKMGHEAVIFESEPVLGGLLSYGIPSYRLPKDILAAEIEYLKNMGVKVRVKNRVEDVENLFKEGFDAVFLGVGAAQSASLGIPGEGFKDVLQGLDLLREIGNGRKPFASGKKVAVVGGGNVATDVARCSVRLGAQKVYMIYRRSLDEMPAYKSEIEAAEEEGVELMLLTAPTRILGNKSGRVVCLECRKQKLGEPDESGRRVPVPIPNSEFTISVNVVIEAVGQRIDEHFIKSNPDIKIHGGLIMIDEETRMTSKRGVFAGGDAVNGGATVVRSVAEGKLAAEAIHEYLSGE
ncbi:MAG TPA: NAD(P)-dependent oxidoreductase [Candidatus Eisenbacteria bacterium]|nr:NAD(P)-dependent oxidoreductase [Candidatus Eisenbacteria bacterium]